MGAGRDHETEKGRHDPGSGSRSRAPVRGSVACGARECEVVAEHPLGLLVLRHLRGYYDPHPAKHVQSCTP